MARLTILHETRYSYDQPVRFGQHRLMLRPRDSHAIRVIEARLAVSPPGRTRWVYDALGNCVCLFQPEAPGRSLSIISRLVIERFPAPLTPDNPHTALPITYGAEDRLLLAPFMAPATDDDDAWFRAWMALQSEQAGEPALDRLMRMTAAIHARFDYRERHAEGVQSPAETLARDGGACRDLAWLMIETLRRQGYAARFVSGYINGASRKGGGATHAWVEVFLPGLGWTEFDPTNGLTESADLIRVAVSRTPGEAAPVSGTLFGDPGPSELDVSVTVSSSEDADAA